MTLSYKSKGCSGSNCWNRGVARMFSRNFTVFLGSVVADPYGDLDLRAI